MQSLVPINYKTTCCLQNMSLCTFYSYCILFVWYIYKPFLTSMFVLCCFVLGYGSVGFVSCIILLLHTVWCLVRCVLQSCSSQHSRTGGHNETSTTRDQRLHVQLRSSWWWTQWCPKHVERNNVNKILRILKHNTSIWRFYWKLVQRCTEPWTWNWTFSYTRYKLQSNTTVYYTNYSYGNMFRHYWVIFRPF